MLIIPGNRGVVQMSRSPGSASGPNMSSSTYADIPQMDITLTGLTIGSILVAEMRITLYHASAGVISTLGFSLDGAAEIEQVSTNAPASNYFYNLFMKATWTVTAASHRVKGRWKVASSQLNAQGVERTMWLSELRTA